MFFPSSIILLFHLEIGKSIEQIPQRAKHNYIEYKTCCNIILFYKMLFTVKSKLHLLGPIPIRLLRFEFTNLFHVTSPITLRSVSFAFIMKKH